jgi:hypothetical protein
MPLGAVISFHDDGRRPHAELVLANGDRVHVRLGPDGMVISRADGPVLFEASPDIVARICASLVPSRSATQPLNVIVAVAVNLPSADALRRAFADATAGM